MANKSSYEAPAKRAVSTTPGYKQAIVEKIPENWGLADPIETFQDMGYEIVSDGARRVVMQMPIEKFEAIEKKVKDDAEARLKATEGIGKVKQTEKSESELKDSLPDVSELDG
jgi:hypothetical protein